MRREAVGLSGAWALSAMAALGASGCVISVDPGRYVSREERRFQVTGIPDVSLTTFDGSVQVRSWDRPEILIEVEKRAGDKAQAEAIEVKTEQSGSTVRVEVRGPAGSQRVMTFGTSPSARVVASVPRRCNVTAHSGDGSIAIERIEGAVDLDTGDGTVKGLDLSGSLHARTGDGSLRFENVSGTIDLESSDGGARISGTLHVLRLRTGDGAVEVQAEEGSAMTADWDIRTGDGGLRLELPADFSANLEATTDDGSVRVRGFGEPTSGARDDDGGRGLTRALGAGGKRLRLRCSSGTILVTRR